MHDLDLTKFLSNVELKAAVAKHLHDVCSC